MVNEYAGEEKVKTGDMLMEHAPLVQSSLRVVLLVAGEAGISIFAFFCDHPVIRVSVASRWMQKYRQLQGPLWR